MATVSCFPGVWAPKSLSYFTSLCSIILCLVIFFGNLGIIVAVIFDPLRKLRTPFSYFLVNLAVSDLVVGGIAMPTSFHAHLTEAEGYVPAYLVTLIHMSYFVSTTASVLSLAALCLDRFIAIKWPIHYRRSLCMSRCMLISALIWLFSASVSLIYLKVGYIDYLMVFVHVSIIVAFFILAVTYRQVYKTLRAQSDALRAVSSVDEDKNEDKISKNRTEQKVTRAFLLILALFICSYAPAIIMIYVLQFCKKCDCILRHVLRDLQFIFVSTNSAMNPFVCAIRLGAFRRSIVALLLCKKRKSKYDPNSSEMNTARKPRSNTTMSSVDAIVGTNENGTSENGSNENGPKVIIVGANKNIPCAVENFAVQSENIDDAEENLTGPDKNVVEVTKNSAGTGKNKEGGSINSGQPSKNFSGLNKSIKGAHENLSGPHRNFAASNENLKGTSEKTRRKTNTALSDENVMRVENVE